MNTRISSSCGGLLAAALILWTSVGRAGERAPGFVLPDLGAGFTFSSDSLRGRVSVVTFWTSWCSPRALELLDGLAREFGSRAFAAIAINLDEDPGAARRYAGGYPPGIALLRDDSGATPLAFDVKAMPATYLLDCEGRIQARYAGVRAHASGELRAQVEAMLATPCEARR